jgi:AMP nucleosidase
MENNKVIGKQEIDPREEAIALETLERYSGSNCSEFQNYLLLTNFPKYVEHFAKKRGLPIKEGSMFKSAHSSEENISIIDYKIGSPAASLVIDLCSFLPVRSALVLGMCGGLRNEYHVGDFFVPVGSIRGEGTSDFYFPQEVPAMANFVIQKMVTSVLHDENARYHIGITHTTNKRFWEFNKSFKERLLLTRPQAIEMECATLFISSYYHKLPLGALLLISDLPLKSDGVKTKKAADELYLKYTSEHVETGVQILRRLDQMHVHKDKGVFRGSARQKKTTEFDLK